MRRLPIKYIKPGIRLSHPIYGSDGRILLAKDVVLTNRYIVRLNELGISSVYIEDEIFKDIVITDVILEETRVKAILQVKELFRSQKIIKLEKDSAENYNYKIFDTIEEIIDQLFTTRNLVASMIDIRLVDDYLFGHSVNVCVLSIITGINLKYDRKRILQLATGALFHDIGKSLIPSNILNKTKKLDESEFDEIKKHPTYSLELLRNNSNISSISRTIAYQHHERCNGEGYPLGLEGNKIHEMSQIVGMADIYDALTADRIYRKAVPPNEAYEMIAGTGGQYFKLDIVQSFLAQIAAYPAGYLVQLSNGEIAIVVDYKKGFTILPRVRVIMNQNGDPQFPLREIRLWEQTKIFVQKILSEELTNMIINKYKSFRK